MTASLQLPREIRAGDYVIEQNADGGVLLWSTDSGDSIEIPRDDLRVVFVALCEAYVTAGRFKNDAERKAYAAAQS